MGKRSQHLVGLEIEPSAVHAASVSVNGRIVLEDAASVPLEPGVVRDGEVADADALAAALKALWASRKGLDKRVRIGIANQKIVVRLLELPPIPDPKELAAAVRFQAADELPMSVDAAVLDFHDLGVVETPAGPRQRVVLVAARRDMVDRVLAAARAAGLRPEGIDLAAFGLVRALARSGPTLYLAVGGLTNLALADGTTCRFTRVVGNGSEQLAVELAERRGMTLDEARTTLAEIGMDRPAGLVDADPALVADVHQVLADGVRRIASEVRTTVDFHRGSIVEDVDAAPLSCVVTGPGAGIPGFADALALELGLEVTAAHVDGDVPGVDPRAVTVAAGLAVAEARA